MKVERRDRGVGKRLHIDLQLPDALRRAEGWPQREAEMRGQVFDRRHFGVLQLYALRAVSRDGEDLGRESGSPAALVVLLKQTRIDLLVFDLGIDLIGAAFFQNHSGQSQVAVPHRETCYERSRRPGEQVFSFQNLIRMTVENLQDLDARMLVVNRHVDLHNLKREDRSVRLILDRDRDERAGLSAGLTQKG